MNYSDVQPISDFNWDEIEDKKVVKNEEAEKAYDATFKNVTDQQVIEGTIVSINDREVVVNIGFKSDGIISASELRYNSDFKAGDTIEVYVESQEDSNGQLQLSHKKARILKSWERVNEAYNSQEIIKGFVKDRTKGGMIVTVFDNIDAFLPGSQIDVKPIRDFDQYVGKEMEFKVVKINHEYKNVVVSHKALIEDELEAQKSEIISNLEQGQVIEGTVKNITNYGVFVDLGGVDGLIHITDLSWGRVKDPHEIVDIDQKINVVITDFDKEKNRIQLGLKQLTPHPWNALDPDLKEGDRVKGKVVVVMDYGAFIEIMPGVEGLIHVSEMSWSQHLRTAKEFLHEGDEVEAVILSIKREEHKMSLGMRQLVPNPWLNINEKYSVGSRHTAIARSFTNFGIFAELEAGIEGLIHISDLSWNKKIKTPSEFIHIGDKIDVVILEIDEENHRLSLGHKQLEDNPWDVYETIYTVGSIHKGTITTLGDKGATITLPYDVEGFAPKSHLEKEDKSKAREGEQLDFKVIEFSKDNRRIVLSHTNIFKESQEAERAKNEKEEAKKSHDTQKGIKKINDGLEKTTIGDVFGDVLKGKRDE